MTLLLDTANIDAIKKFAETGIIAGVTTNPSLMAKESKGDYVEKLKEIADALMLNRGGLSHLSVEVTTLDPKKMIEEASQLNEILRARGKLDLHVKIPLMLETLEVIGWLHDMKIKVNATACMTALQAKLAQQAGADVVSFFYNRIKDGSGSPDQVLEEFQRIRGAKEHAGQMQIICA